MSNKRSDSTIVQRIPTSSVRDNYYYKHVANLQQTNPILQNEENVESLYSELH